MKIYDERIKAKEFMYPGIGSCFIHDKQIWIKTDYNCNGIHHNAICISRESGGDNNMKLFDKHDIITPVEIEIHIVK